MMDLQTIVKVNEIADKKKEQQSKEKGE